MKRISYTFACGLIGLFFFLMGTGLFWFGTKSLIRMWAWERLTLKNGSEAMTRWITPPQPLILKIYIFNVTNPLEVSEGALPVFSEVGPYVYEETRGKVNIMTAANYTLTYNLKNNIRFEQKRSGKLKQSDKITILNVPLIGAILSIYEAVPEFVGLVDQIWPFFYPGEDTVFITITVRELLFDGINIDCSSKITEVYLACRALETRNTYSVRKEGKNFKFSFLHARNGTSPETYRVSQGLLDLKQSAQFVGMDNSSSVNKWKDKYCDMINGSDGAQFPVMLDKTKKLYVFIKDLCRSVYLNFEEEYYKHGVKLYKYSLPSSLLASPEENPDNACFCRYPFALKDLVQESEVEVEETQERICFQNGALPLLPCIGAPMAASFPHFYMGDQSYINFSGLHPSKEKHETYVEVEPNSGISIAAYKRLQFNLEIKRIEDVQVTSKLAEGLFPVLWVEEGIELSSDLFKLLRYTLVQKQVLEQGTIVFIVGGLVLLIGSYIVRLIIDKSLICEKTKMSKSLDWPMLSKLSEYPTQKNTTRVYHLQKAKVSDGENFKRPPIQPDGIIFQGHSLIDNFM